MREKLITAIREIRNENTILTLDEASVKSRILQFLLSLLGWNLFDPNEVKPEYGVESKAADFSLRINGITKVLIEVKRANESLALHQKQLLEYSFIAGVKLAVLTNGLQWWFYLPLNEGGWEQRRFFTADLLREEPGIIAERFIGLLSKEKVASGEAVQAGIHLYNNRPKGDFVETNTNKKLSKTVSGWTVNELRLKADSLPNIKLGFRLTKILDWALPKGILMETGKGGMPRMRIGGKQNGQIALIRYNGELYFILREGRYSGGIAERNEFIGELRKIGLSLRLNLNEITDGSAIEKKLDELTDIQFQSLLEILGKHSI